MNYTIKCVDRDMDSFSFNTAVARLMEFVNAIYKYDLLEKEKDIKLLKDAVHTLILLLAPMTPHFSEELWSHEGNKTSVFNAQYPEYNEEYLVLDETEYGVQINSKIRTKIVLNKNLTKEEIQQAVLSNDKVKELIADKEIAKVIVVPLRLINIIVK